MFIFTYFWLRRVSVAACWLSLAVKSGASRWGGFSRCGTRALGRGFSSCDARALSLCTVWIFLEPRIEPMSAALAGRFLTSGPPGKSAKPCFKGFQVIQAQESTLLIKVSWKGLSLSSSTIITVWRTGRGVCVYAACLSPPVLLENILCGPPEQEAD